MFSLNKGAVFKTWLNVYKVPAGISVNAWIVDLAQRIRQLQSISESITSNKDLSSLKLWIGGFFGPQAFITATRQYSAAKHQWALEQTVLRFEARSSAAANEIGFVLTGVKVEGATIENDVISTSPTLSYAIPSVVLRWSKGDERTQELVQLPVYLNSTRREEVFKVRLSPGAVHGSELYKRGVDIILSGLAGGSL